MKIARVSAQSRARLDQRLAQLGSVEQYRTPSRGWIRAIRQALGMSTAQLAKRLGVRQPSVVGLERSEEKGTIAVATLQKVAEALDCTLVYALVPNQSLEATVRARARALLRRRRQPIEHSMLLEDQDVAEPVSDRQVEDMIRETSPRRFWD